MFDDWFEFNVFICIACVLNLCTWWGHFMLLYLANLGLGRLYVLFVYILRVMGIRGDSGFVLMYVI